MSRSAHISPLPENPLRNCVSHGQQSTQCVRATNYKRVNKLMNWLFSEFEDTISRTAQGARGGGVSRSAHTSPHSVFFVALCALPLPRYDTHTLLASYLPCFVFYCSSFFLSSFFFLGFEHTLFGFLGGMRCSRFQLQVLNVCTSTGLIHTYDDL